MRLMLQEKWLYLWYLLTRIMKTESDMYLAMLTVETIAWSYLLRIDEIVML